VGEQTGYEPFSQALSQLFGTSPLRPATSQLRSIDTALDGVFDTVIPFAGLLFPSEEASPSDPKSSEELFPSIVRTLQHQASRGPLIVLIEDLQWADPQSRSLLEYLYGALPPGADSSLAFIFTSRVEPGSPVPDPDRVGVALPIPDVPMRVDLLTGALGLPNPMAVRVVSAVDGVSSESSLLWLFSAAAHLARHGAIEIKGNVPAWAAAYESGGVLPLPAGLQQMISDQLQKVLRHRMLLACASCIGLEFDPCLVAAALELPLMEVLSSFDEIERATGIVVGRRRGSDLLSFRSTAILEAVRRELDIEDGQTPDAPVSRMQREFHLRLARELEAEGDGEEGAKVLELARHYGMAGPRYAEMGIHYAVRAGRIAASRFDFEGARSHLEHAQRLGEGPEDRGDLEREGLLMACRQAHTGQEIDLGPVRSAAERAVEGATLDSELAVAAARACIYLHQELGGEALIPLAVRLGEKLAEQGEPGPDQARGHLFMAFGEPPSSRIQHLESALAEVSFASKDPQVLSTRAEVLNALAETLSHGAARDESRAMGFFKESLEIQERPQLRDLPGMARSHGGMGRFYYYAEPPDPEMARPHLLEDLRISQEIGDLKGQSQMHSLLGGCALLEGRSEVATEHYGSALSLARRSGDVIFAGVGLVESFLAAGDTIGAKIAAGLFGERVAEISAPPAGALRRLREAAEEARETVPELMQVAEKLVPVQEELPGLEELRGLEEPPAEEGPEG
jgi:tetratricopeptide (TPR) repeat protein